VQWYDFPSALRNEFYVTTMYECVYVCNDMFLLSMQRYLCNDTCREKFYGKRAMTRLAIASTIYERYQQQREILGRANEPFGAAWNLAAECCLDAVRTCGADHMVLDVGAGCTNDAFIQAAGTGCVIPGP
jgi:hypothetical protein